MRLLLITGLAAALMASSERTALHGKAGSERGAGKGAAVGAASLRPAGTVALSGVTGRIDHLAVDTAGGRLFVAALGNNTIEVVDLKRREVVGHITGLHHPQGLGFIPATHTLVVANADDPLVRFYDATTLKPVHEVRLGEDCDNVRVDAGARRVYVGYGDGAIAGLDLDANKVMDVPVGAHPESFQLETRGPRIFVNVPDRGEVVVVDRAQQKVTAHWKVGAAAANFPMALDEPGGRLFIGCRRPARLLTLDLKSGATTGNVEIVADTDDLFYDDTAKQVLVIGGGGAITIVDASGALRAADRTETSSGARTGLWIRDSRELIVAAPRRDGRDAELLLFQQ